MLGNFLETICWEIFGNYMLGNLLETICWQPPDGNHVLGNSGVIMAQCYGITLRFQSNGTRGSVEHPGSTDFSRRMHSKASEVIGSVEQGMRMRNPSGSSVRTSWWASAAASK